MRKAFLAIMLSVVMVLPIPFLGVTRSQEIHTPDWTHIHGDPYHTAYSTVELSPPLKLLWKKPFATAPHDNVVACWNGDVPLLFSGDGEGTFFCLKPDTGEIVWKFKAENGYFLGSPTIFTSSAGQKRVVAVSSESIRNGTNPITVYCMDMDGKIVWRKNLTGSFCESAPTAQNGVLYVAVGLMSSGSSKGGYLYKLNQETGDQIWRANLPNAPATASPTLIGDKVYISCSNLHVGDFDGVWLGAYVRGATFVSINDSNGSEAGRVDFGNMRMDILTVYHDGEIILSGQKVAVKLEVWEDPRTGAKFLVEREVPMSLVSRIDPSTLMSKWLTYPQIYNQGEIYAHTPIVSKDWIITGADEGMIYAYNKRDTLKSWSYKLGVGVRLCMAASENYIYLNEGDTPPNCCPGKKAKFKIIDIWSGRVLWDYTLDALGTGGVSIFDNYVYTFDRDNLYCFTRSGPPKLMVDPIRIDLGEIPKGKTEKTSFRVWNGGEGVLAGNVKFNVPYMKLSSDQFMLEKEPKEFICTIDTTTLNIGEVYNIPIQVDAKNGESQTVIITFTITGQPILKVDPLSIDFGNVEKGTYSEESIFIDNIGEGTLRGNIKSDMTWLSLEYNNWVGNHKKLTITADTTLLDYNRDYKANIFFESNGGLATVTVKIRTKQKGPRLIVYPEDFTYTDINWGDKISGTFAISNSGIATLDGWLEVPCEWLQLSSKDFSLTIDPKDFKFEIDTKNLPDGKTTSCEIPVKSNGGLKVVKISISIKPRPPQLKVDPPTLFFNQCVPGQIYDGKITVTNLGSGILSGTISPGPNTPWLKIKQGSFDISKVPLEVPILIDTEGMAKGTSYTGKIIVESNGGTDEVGLVVVMSEKKRFTVELWIGSYDARINGNPAKLDWPPYINKGTTMVPARFIAEAFGCIVDFYPKHKATEEIYISKGSTQITLYIGKNYALINNEQVKLDVPAEIKNKRTFVPIRFISEVFGADVTWDKDTQKVTIGYWEN